MSDRHCKAPANLPYWFCEQIGSGRGAVWISASEWGSEGRRFESSRPDILKPDVTVSYVGLLCLPKGGDKARC